MPSNSLWLESRESRFPTLTDKIKTHTVVVGGGLAGMTTAYYLAKAGADVVVLEARQIGSGTTGHTTAHITSQHDLTYDRWIKRFGFEKARLIAQANESAIREIYNIITTEHIDCNFVWQDAFAYTKDSKKVKDLVNEQKAASSLGIDASLVDGNKFALGAAAALCFKNQAMFNPYKYICGLADATVKYGGRIFENSRVLHIDGNVVSTKSGAVKAENIVIATHNPLINFPGMYFARMYQDRSYCMAFENAPYIDGMWVSLDSGGHTFRMYQDLLIVCGEDHKCGFDTNTNHYKKLESFSYRSFPGVKPIYQWSAQDGITLDNLPYIGKYSKNSRGLYVATGFGKWGMTQSNIAGGILSDLIMKIPNPYAKIYDPGREVVPYAFFNAIYQNLATAVHLIGGFAVRFSCPNCAHMKCKLAWNRDERTWDCPCHGSRFTKGGEVLDSPAIHDIYNLADKEKNYEG